MSTLPSNLKQPIGSRWDVDFTRISKVVRHRVSLCMVQLTVLLRNAGLSVQPAFRVHGAGLSGSLNVVGRRGALASIEFNLVDGLAEAGTTGAALDINLLAADGEVVAFCSPMRAVGVDSFRAQAEDILATAGTGLDANVLYGLLVEHFDLVLEQPRKMWSR